MKHGILLVIAMSIWHISMGQSLVLHLKMDKEASANIHDYSPKGNHALIQGNGGIEFTQDRFGNDCRALHFNGGGYLRISHHKSLNLNSQFTVAAWVRIKDGTSTDNLQWLTLVCKGEDTQENDYSPAFRVQLTSQTASVNTASTKSIDRVRQSFPADIWFHLAVVFDGSALIIYQDGLESSRFVLYDPIYINSDDLNIGRDVPGDTEFFVGDMDDLRIYDGIVDANGVATLANDRKEASQGSACPQSPPLPTATPTPTPKQKVLASDIPDWSTMQVRPTLPNTSQQPVVSTKIPQPHPKPAPVDTTPVVVQPPAPAVKPVSPDPYSFKGVAQNNLILLLDVSKSMNNSGKLSVLKEAFLKLIPYMRAEDQISIVSFAGSTDIILDGVSASDKRKITMAIADLVSAGDTRGKIGLRKAYKIARKNYIGNGNNRIILATDGGFSVPDLYDLAEDISNDDIYLSIFSFGKPIPSRQEEMAKLALLGGGNHAHITPQNINNALLKEVKAIRN